jgi:6-phosphogluconolactonase (cycloisomerase 2 family)
VEVDPKGQFLYVANNGLSGYFSGVAAFSIDASGALTHARGSPFKTGAAPTDVTVDPTGKFAYATNQGAGNVYAYTIDATTGALKRVAGSPFAAGDNPYSVATCRVEDGTCKP